MNEKKGWMSDYIDEIIDTNAKRILLKAGVGSGKSHMAINYLSSRGKTLFITSRKSPKMQAFSEACAALGAASTLQVSEYDSNLFIAHQWDIQNDDLGSIKPDNFQFIVIDEIHLLVSDTFSESAYYVGKFIQSIPPEVCLIMMSACAERISEYITQYLDIDFCYIDLSDQVFTVKPQTVRMINSSQAMKNLLNASGTNKMLYFCSATDDAYKMEDFLVKHGIQAVAITSQPENRQDEEAARKSREINTLKYIEHNERYPDDIDVVITTSKLREGINLKDHNIKAVFSELKDYVSIIQCAGRVRHGVEEFCLIKDKGNRYAHFDGAIVDEARRVLSTVNELIDKHADLHIDQIVSFEPLQKKYGKLVIRYNNHFVINEGLVYEHQYREADHRLYYQNPEKYVESLLGMPAQQPVNIDDIIKPYVGKKINKLEKDALVKDLNRMGFNGAQLKFILKGTRYGLTVAKNYSRYQIQERGFSGKYDFPI